MSFTITNDNHFRTVVQNSALFDQPGMSDQVLSYINSVPYTDKTDGALTHSGIKLILSMDPQNLTKVLHTLIEGMTHTGLYRTIYQWLQAEGSESVSLSTVSSTFTDDPCVDSVPETAKTPLVFHKDFSTKKSGDVILQAGDEEAQCCYFRLDLLKSLSTFFANLPTPSSDDDLVDGVPLIPLHGTTSRGVTIFLGAIASTTTSDPYAFDETDYPIEAILDAAVVGRIYDVPVLPRLLQESLLDADETDAYLTFAVWAIGGVENKLAEAARSTVVDSYLISQVPSHIVTMCRSHAAGAWSQLQDLHLRHYEAILIFRSKILDYPAYKLPFDIPNHATRKDGITICEGLQINARRVRTSLLAAGRPKRLQELKSESFELDCLSCAAAAEERYEDLYDWLEDFAFLFEVDDSLRWDESLAGSDTSSD